MPCSQVTCSYFLGKSTRFAALRIIKLACSVHIYGPHPDIRLRSFSPERKPLMFTHYEYRKKRSDMAHLQRLHLLLSRRANFGRFKRASCAWQTTKNGSPAITVRMFPPRTLINLRRSPSPRKRNTSCDALHPAWLLPNGSALDGSSSQLLEPQQHGEHSFELAVVDDTHSHKQIRSAFQQIIQIAFAPIRPRRSERNSIGAVKRNDPLLPDEPAAFFRSSFCIRPSAACRDARGSKRIRRGRQRQSDCNQPSLP